MPQNNLISRWGSKKTTRKDQMKAMRVRKRPITQTTTPSSSDEPASDSTVDAPTLKIARFTEKRKLFKGMFSYF